MSNGQQIMGKFSPNLTPQGEVLLFPPDGNVYLNQVADGKLVESRQLNQREEALARMVLRFNEDFFNSGGYEIWLNVDLAKREWIFYKEGARGKNTFRMSIAGVRVTAHPDARYRHVLSISMDTAQPNRPALNLPVLRPA